MTGAKGGSRYAVPDRIVPERGQVSENSSEAPTKEACGVLHDRVTGSKIVKQSSELKPERRTRAIKTPAWTGQRDVLAGEASADRVNGNSICGKAEPGELRDVGIDRHLGPVFRQHVLAEGIDLAEGHGPEMTRPLEPEAQTTNPGEEIEQAHHAEAPSR